MMARMKHVGPEESLMKSSQLARFESDALTDKISKPILSLSVDLKHQIGRRKCSGGVLQRMHAAQEKREEILSEAVDDGRKNAAYPWCYQGTKFQQGKGYATCNRLRHPRPF